MTGLALFRRELSRRPFGAVLGLSIEYAAYVAAWIFVLLLLLTRLPLRWLDRVCGLRLRERFIELIARVAKG